MIKQNKKGFTLVELVIVIAVVAILAGVLIGTFASVINRANDSANIQKTKSDEIAQKAEDIIKKIEDSGWVSWEDYEADIVAKIVEEFRKDNNATAQVVIDGVVKEVVTTYRASTENNAQASGVTEDQVKAIVENAIGTLQYEGPTEAQVRAAVSARYPNTELSSSDVKAIVDKANDYKYTSADLARSIAIIVNDFTGVDTILDCIKDSERFLGEQIADLKDTIKSIIDEAILNQELDDVVMAKALNIKIKRVGLTSADTPYEVLKEIKELDSTETFKSTMLLSLGEQFGFFVVDGVGKVVNPCGLTLTVDDGVLTDAYKYWTFLKSPSAKYSTYLIGTDASVTGDITTGLDVGLNEIGAINYTRVPADDEDVREVAIRTAGGTLTIHAENDTVNHYGEGLVLDIQAIAGSSYHEFGHFPKAKITKGRLVVEEKGSISTIVIDSTSTDDVTIDISKVTVEEAPVVYAENETVAAQLSTIVEASQEVKDSSIQTVVYTKHVTSVDELSTALNENGYVILDNDIIVTNPIWIAEIVGEEANLTDHKVTLDLNTHTISVVSSFEGRPIMNCAELTITGDGTISSANAGDGGWGAVRNYNKLTIENGTYMGSPYGGGSAIDNWMGELTINDGWFGGTGSLNNRDNGVAVINGGRFVSEACSKLPGNVWCYALRSSGKITINNAYVRGAQGGVAIYGGYAVINYVDSEAYDCSTAEGQMVDHSTHTDVSYYALYIAGESTSTNCVVNGGKFKSNRYYAVLIGNSTPGDGGNREKAHVTIYGGEFTSPSNQKVIKLNGELGSAYLFGGKYSNNNIFVGETSRHLTDISSFDVTETIEDGWYVLK